MAVAGICGAGALAQGCFSSSSAPDMDAAQPELDAGSVPDSTTPTPVPEAGPEAQPDTYVAEGAAPEASAPEASVDAGDPVTVVVRSVSGPEQGISVVFQDAFNEIVGTVTTDTLGRASMVVPPGSQVTAVMGTPTAPRLVTVEAVAPGDLLAVYDPSFDSLTTSVSVDVADGAPPATSYFTGAIGSCSLYGGGGLPMTTVLTNADCQSQGKFPVLVFAVGGADAGYQTLAYAFSKGNQVPTDGGPASVVIAGPWYTDMGAYTIDAVGADGGNAPTGNWTMVLDEVADGVTVPSTGSFDLLGTFSNQVELYPSYGDGQQVELHYIQYNSGSAQSSQSVVGVAVKPVGDGGPLLDGGSVNVDLGQLQPLITDVSFQNPGLILTWGGDAGLVAGADGVLAQVAWTDATDAGATVQGTWALVAPPGVRRAVLPQLPSAFAALAPSPSAMFATPTVAVIDADFITGYDQFRRAASSLPLSQNLVHGSSVDEMPPLPVDGTLHFTAVTTPGD